MGLFSIINEVFSETEIDVKERLDTVETCFDIVFDKLPSVEIFNKIIENVPKRDSLKILLMNDSDDMITLTNDCVDTQKYSEFIFRCKKRYTIPVYQQSLYFCLP